MINKVKPHVFALMTFLVVGVVYFAPLFFEGKEISQSDIVHFKGIAKEIEDHREQYGEEPLWTNSLFGGMPAYMVSCHYNGNLIGVIKTTIFSFIKHPLQIFLLGMISFYVLMMSYKVKPIIAVFGSIAFALCTFSVVTVEAGHNVKVAAVHVIPLILAGIKYTLDKKLLLGFAVASLGVALQMHFGHFQITFYTCFLIAIIMAVELYNHIKKQELPSFIKSSVLLAFAALLGVATSSARLLSTMEYLDYSTRGKSDLVKNEGEKNETGLAKNYVFDWSLGKFESLGILIPNLVGGSSTEKLSENSTTYKTLKQNNVPTAQAKAFVERVPLYWGDMPFTAGPVYFGAIICFLFVLSLFILEKNIKIWLIISVVLSFMLSWGKNLEFFNYLLYDYFPGFDKFRTVMVAIIIAQVSFFIASMLVLKKIIDSKDKAIFLKDIYKATGITAGLAVLLALMAGSFSMEGPSDAQLAKQAGWLIESIKLDRISALRTDALKSAFFILLSAGLLWAFIKNKLNETTAFVIIGLLTVADLWIVDKRYLNNEDFVKNVEKEYFQPSEADLFILQDKSNYRVINTSVNPFTDSKTSYFHKSVGGYSAVKMKRFQELVDNQISKNNMNVLNMLNTKYFIQGTTKDAVKLNNNALGNAWFVSNIQTVENANDEMDALTDFKPKNTAILNKSQFDVSKTEFDNSGSIELKEYKANNLKYQYKTENDGFVVFSEVFYDKGWTATIDGKESKYVRVNYLLRGMEVPKGEHTIEFTFRPKTYYTGNTVSLISSILLLAAFGFVVFQEVKKMNEKA